MMVSRPETVQVWADLEQWEKPALVGTLRSRSSRTGDLFSFEYDAEWLQRPGAFAFDPDLALVGGVQYPAAKRASFGIFLDSSPDRWGRVLMQRRENIRARKARTKARSLTEWDFLLGVHDETRLGALRFADTQTGKFIDFDDQLAAPPITSLGDLQSASLHFEQHMDEERHPQYEMWLSQLFAPGTSLGGARPKASVRDESGRLCLAKFPSHRDRGDVGAWELVAHRIAERAGIRVPPVRSMRIGGSPYTTFVARRFDRSADGLRRRAFVSAMTLTQRSDGDEGASYLELIDLLQSQGSAAHADCTELFRRVVFNILIHNIDDHLRNHGFFISDRGITLSPAYDMNPSIERNELSLAINEVETACDVSIAMDSHDAYGLKAADAKRIVMQVGKSVSMWRAEAKKLGISKGEQDLMASAFEH